jgi:hypothetical protein
MEGTYTKVRKFPQVDDREVVQSPQDQKESAMKRLSEMRNFMVQTDQHS